MNMDNWWTLAVFFQNPRIIRQIEQKTYLQNILRDLTRNWTQIACLAVRRLNHYTRMFSYCQAEIESFSCLSDSVQFILFVLNNLVQVLMNLQFHSQGLTKSVTGEDPEFLVEGDWPYRSCQCFIFVNLWKTLKRFQRRVCILAKSTYPIPKLKIVKICRCFYTSAHLQYANEFFHNSHLIRRIEKKYIFQKISEMNPGHLLTSQAP